MLKQMGKGLLEHVPYIIIILANGLYIYTHGVNPIRYSKRLFLYNFIFFILISIFVFFKATQLLHRWFVLEQGDVKQVTKDKIKVMVRYWQTFWNWFTPGNQAGLIKLYSFLAIMTMLGYLIPTELMGLLLTAIFQLKGKLYNAFKEPIDAFMQQIYQQFMAIISHLPRYQRQSRQNSMKKVGSQAISQQNG